MDTAQVNATGAVPTSQQAPPIVSTFPMPPPFYTLFADGPDAVPPPRPISGAFQLYGKVCISLT